MRVVSFKRRCVIATIIIVCGAVLSSVASAANEISFRKDIFPILEGNCVECHKPGGKGFESSGLSLESYEGVMKGTKFGPVIVPGDIFTSNLLRAVFGQVNSAMRMPFHRRELPEKDGALLLHWIYQGAKNN
ncbi:exported hypothetical protein [Azospirillaceae bacterium]